MSKRTIMIFPELENINVINDIREKYDPLADILLPHITLVFPFDSVMTNEDLVLYLEECLRNIQPFHVQLEGFSKQHNDYGNYLLMKVVQGSDVIKTIHDKLYRDQPKVFGAGIDYVPHMTVGKLPSVELLEKAYDDVNECNENFSTVVKKITVEMIGKNEESIIIIEHELH